MILYGNFHPFLDVELLYLLRFYDYYVRQSSTASTSKIEGNNLFS